MDKLKLNDLLGLTEEEIQRTKIRFNQSNGVEEPLDLFVKNPDTLLRWNYWNSQSYKIGQISVGLVKMNYDEWLLFTVGTITGIKDIPFNSGIGFLYNTENERFGKLFGRVVVKYRKRFQSQFPNASTVLDDLIVKEVLPGTYSGFEFPGYDRVSLSFEQLETIINGNYPSYRNALQNQKAVYLQTDKQTGKMYVGSATAQYGMLLSRWSAYVDNGHGGNIGLKELIEEKGFDYIKKNFQYTIIENFNAKVDDKYVLERESYWKEVFQSRKFGYNHN